MQPRAESGRGPRSGPRWCCWRERCLSLVAMAALLALAACASVAPLTVDPATVPVDPPQLAAARDAGAVATYQAPDGQALAYRAYRTGPAPADTALVYIHGIESHGVWFALAAEGLQRKGYDVFLLDRRGSGLNRENRGLVSGDAASADQLLGDVRSFVDGLDGRYRHVVLVGLSWGGKLALAEALTATNKKPDGLILITPGLVPAVGYGPLETVQIATASLMQPQAAFRTPIEPEMFTTTPVWLAFIKDDPLRLRTVTARFLLATRGLDRIIARGANDRQTRSLLIQAGQDRIVDNAGNRLLMARGPGDLAILTYPEETHSVQLDDVDRLVEDMSAWLEGRP